MMNSKSNLESIIKINSDNRKISIANTFDIPFTDKPLMTEDPRRAEKIIEAFNDIIIKALQDRMTACLDMLLRNKSRVVFCNDYQIVFKRLNGSEHTFNIPSYKVMSDAIEILQHMNIVYLKKAHYDQIVKALYWVDKPENRKGFSFGNLISCITEMLMFTEA